MAVSTKIVKLGLGQVEIRINDDGKVIDFASNKVLRVLSSNPEEAVRQWYEHELIDKYGYNPKQIDIEVSIQMGSATKNADIVVYEDLTKVKKLIIIETKRPEKKEGITQLQSYLEASGTEFGVWTNGNDHSYWYHSKSQVYDPIGRIIKSGETIDDLESPKLRKELEPAQDLVSDFKSIEQYIIAHQGGLDTFDEIFKVIFAKIYDEKKNLKGPNSSAFFRAGIKEPSGRVRERIVKLFAGAKTLYSDVFTNTEEIKLNGEVLKWVVLLLQNYILSETDMDILGTGFEILVNPKMKSDKGQYFTPRQVVRAAIEMLDLDENMKIVDPACGSGGFLIYGMEHVWRKIDSEWASPIDALAEKLLYAQTKVFGSDYDDRLARVAKAYMAIWGDGRSHIYSVPCSIKSYEWQGSVSEQIVDGSFDALLTNPPFAGDLNLVGLNHHFDLGQKNGQNLESQRKDILFIGRALDLVKSASVGEKTGLIAIVLPKGDLDEREKQYVRDHILSNSMILAVISLHKLTFVPFTSQKTALVILKHMIPEEIPENYKIFMAVSELPGKDKSGKLIYVTDEDGETVYDEYQRPKLKTDLFDIAKEFVNKKPIIGFYVDRRDIVGRINAEYYHPKYMEIRNKIIRGPYIQLKDILIEQDGIINGKDLSSLSVDGKRHYSEEGLPYLRVGDVKDNEIDLIGAEKIDADAYDISSFPCIQVGDLLVTRKGTTGRSAVVSEEETHAILSSEIIRIRLRGTINLQNGEQVNIYPYYVSAYINSFYGKQMILQKQTGGISEGINQPELKEMEIPILPEEEMKRISDAYEDSNKQLRGARNNIHTLPLTFETIIP